MLMTFNKVMGQISNSLNCEQKKIIIAKYNTKNYRLPNVAQLARQLSKNELKNMKYDLNTESWYIIEDNIWKRIGNNKALQNVWNILENKEETKYNLTPEYNKRVYSSLALCSGVEFCSRQK